MSDVKTIPDGFSTVTPHLVCRNCADAIEFYKKAFGAEDMGRMLEPNTKKIIHAMIKIGDSVVMLVDYFPNWGNASPESLGGTPVTIHLYVEDADSFVERAVEAGAKITMELMDSFWGDRYGKIVDPFGHEWSVATHIKDVSPKQMEEAVNKMFGQQ